MSKNIKQLVGYRITDSKGNKQLFNNICFSALKGCLLYVYGPNGSGKTTLLKIIAALSAASKGNIICNEQILELTPITRGISFMKSHPVFDEDQTVVEYLTHWAFAYNGVNKLSYESIYRSLDRVGLNNEKYHKISFLSLGQRKRLQISLALLVNRLVWIMDEPTIGLDKYWVGQLSLLIEEKCIKGGIVILTTHTQITINNVKTHSIYIGV